MQLKCIMKEEILLLKYVNNITIKKMKFGLFSGILRMVLHKCR